MMIPTHRNNGLVLATLDDVRMKLGNDRAQEIERVTPVIKSLAAMLKIAGLTIEDLSEESRRIVRTLNASDEERKILRKNVIEIVWHKMKKKGIK